jgi:hypothetical protein
MATTFHQTYINHNDSTTIYTPILCYALTTSSISQYTLQNIQKPIINVALSWMGFNKHMPRAVVFASKIMGGMGIMYLYIEQGVLQTNAIISHLRSESYLANQLRVLLETYQVTSSIFGCLFHGNTKTHYVQSNWVQSVQGYLQHINSSIIIPGKPTILPLRQNDTPIMSAPTEQFTKSDLQEINACIFLQVISLAEIVTQNGDSIIQYAINGEVDAQGSPTLWQISKSLLKWPRQPKPSPVGWKKWKKFLQGHTDSKQKLNNPLCQWFKNTHQTRHWHFRLYNRELIQ